MAHLEAALRPRGKPEIVGNEDATERVPPLQVFEQIDDVALGILVEVAGRLVGEQQRRCIDERAGHGNPALLPAGHAVRIGLCAIRETDAREQLVRPRVGVLGWHGAAEQRRNGDVIGCGQVR